MCLPVANKLTAKFPSRNSNSSSSSGGRCSGRRIAINAYVAAQDERLMGRTDGLAADSAAAGSKCAPHPHADHTRRCQVTKVTMPPTDCTFRFDFSAWCVARCAVIITAIGLRLGCRCTAIRVTS